MNRYSKISDSNRSRSTDLFPLPQTPRKSTSSIPKPNPQTSKTPKNTQPTQQEVIDDDEVNGKRFGEVLSRARSVSSTSTTPRTSSSTPSSSSTPRAMMKRAFSMRRSASVSEGYSRIHDRSVSLASPIEDDDEEGVVRSGKKQDRRGKILKVCKRLFGL